MHGLRAVGAALLLYGFGPLGRYTRVLRHKRRNVYLARLSLVRLLLALLFLDPRRLL